MRSSEGGARLGGDRERIGFLGLDAPHGLLALLARSALARRDGAGARAAEDQAAPLRAVGGAGRGGPAPQQAVRETLSIEKSSMVVFVDHLERLGLVERHRNPENRRAYKLTLTAAGRELLSEAKPLIEKVEEAVLAPLDDAQRRHLHQLLLSLLPHSGERTHG
jgi:DNA-binding MarR family transcriptional regulator